MMSTFKRCTKCGQTKHVQEFHNSGRGRRRPDCKDCRRQYRAGYNAANRERIRGQWRSYYESNKDKESERKAAWYQVNRDRILARQRAYREAQRANSGLSAATG
jgi:transposase-like protein